MNMDMDIPYAVWLILSIFSVSFGQQTRNTFILKSTCHLPKRWIYRNNSIVFCDDPNILACPDKSNCEQIWLEKYACCGFDEEHPLFPYPEVEEEAQQVQLKHLIRARPKPKKRIKLVQTDRGQIDHSALPLSGAVRLKGKAVGQGSIAKLPIEHLFSLPEEPTIGSVWTTTQSPFNPPEEAVQAEPTFDETELGAARWQKTEMVTMSTVQAPSELLEFADFVKQLLQRKMKWKMNNAARQKSQEDNAPNTTRLLGESVITAPSTPTHQSTETKIIENGWRVIDNGDDGVFNNQDAKRSSEDEAMKAMYRRLHPKPSLFPPKVIDTTGTGPRIHIIQEGDAEQIDVGQYKFIASITLIQDQELGEHGVPPSDVHFVVTTHGHPDHAGNINLFPDALHYAGHFAIYQSKFKLTDLFEHDKLSLNENVELQRTPGHTSEDISVIVRHSQLYGNVAISGDTFIAKEDLEYPAMWQPLAHSEMQQRDSRRKILCQVDHIVPGHGKMFQVTPEMRQKFLCNLLG